MIKHEGFNPYPHNLFSIQIFTHSDSDSNGKESTFASIFDRYLRAMPLLIQQIDLPQFDITNNAFHVHTQNGEYKSIGNNIVNAQSQLKLSMLDTEDSIIDHFFYPWLNIIAYAGVYDIGGDYANICKGKDWPYPRIDIQINYYLDNEIKKYIQTNQSEQPKPNFIYKFYGCFPYKVQSVNVRHTVPVPNEYIRAVIFQYNNAICIPNNILGSFYGQNSQKINKNYYQYVKKEQELRQLTNKLQQKKTELADKMEYNPQDTNQFNQFGKKEDQLDARQANAYNSMSYEQTDNNGFVGSEGLYNTYKLNQANQEKSILKTSKQIQDTKNKLRSLSNI